MLQKERENYNLKESTVKFPVKNDRNRKQNKTKKIFWFNFG